MSPLFSGHHVCVRRVVCIPRATIYTHREIKRRISAEQLRTGRPTISLLGVRPPVGHSYRETIRRCRNFSPAIDTRLAVENSHGSCLFCDGFESGPLSGRVPVDGLNSDFGKSKGNVFEYPTLGISDGPSKRTTAVCESRQIVPWAVSAAIGITHGNRLNS